MRITEDQTICGIPAFILQGMFIKLHNRGWGIRFEKSILSELTDDAISIVQKLSDEGYIDLSADGSFTCTVKGNGLALASKEDPITRTEADILYQKFLQGVKEYNSDKSRDHIIVAVDLFGSYMTDSPTVNDIDLAVEIAPRGYTATLMKHFLLKNKKEFLKPEDLQLKSLCQVTEFFRGISSRYSIHHYREIASFYESIEGFTMKQIYLDNSDDAKSFELAKCIRLFLNKKARVVGPGSHTYKGQATKELECILKKFFE